jgi:hypothetical protein
MQDQKNSPSWIITQMMMEQFSPLTRKALQFCSLSFLSLPSGNALLITYASDDVMRLLECTQLLEIAWVFQKTFGKTLICLYHAQKDLLARLDGEQLSRGFPKQLQ